MSKLYGDLLPTRNSSIKKTYLFPVLLDRTFQDRWGRHWGHVTHHCITANGDKCHAVHSGDEMGMSKLVQGVKDTILKKRTWTEVWWMTQGVRRPGGGGEGKQSGRGWRGSQAVWDWLGLNKTFISGPKSNAEAQKDRCGGNDTVTFAYWEAEAQGWVGWTA